MLEPPNPICGVHDEEATVRVGARLYGSRFRKLTVELPRSMTGDQWARAWKWISRDAFCRVGPTGELVIREVESA